MRAVLLVEFAEDTHPAKENHMKKSLVLLSAALLLAATLAFAQTAPKAPKDYQANGPIVELTDTMIVIERGKKKDRWEIARTKDTKIAGELKVGSTVTVKYRMVAAEIQVKPAKAAPAPAK
jgi:hypothetical protein